MRIKLVCFPYAGAPASIYIKWKKYLHNSIDLYPVELSARGRRSNERPYNSIKEAAEDVYRLMKDDLYKHPFAFFGHSMGSLIAFELGYLLMEQGCREPLHFFFSGRNAPHIPKEGKLIYNAEFSAVKEELLRLGGTPSDFFEYEQLVKTYLPLIRADYRIVETYVLDKKERELESSITVLNGRFDPVTDDRVGEWRKYTGKEFRVVSYDGGHFYINDFAEEVCSLINSTLLEEVKFY